MRGELDMGWIAWRFSGAVFEGVAVEDAAHPVGPSGYVKRVAED